MFSAVTLFFCKVVQGRFNVVVYIRNTLICLHPHHRDFLNPTQTHIPPARPQLNNTHVLINTFSFLKLNTKSRQLKHLNYTNWGKQVSVAYLPLLCTNESRVRSPVPALTCTWFPVQTCFRKGGGVPATLVFLLHLKLDLKDLKSDQRALLESSDTHCVRLPSLSIPHLTSKMKTVVCVHFLTCNISVEPKNIHI